MWLAREWACVVLTTKYTKHMKVASEGYASEYQPRMAVERRERPTARRHKPSSLRDQNKTNPPPNSLSGMDRARARARARARFSFPTQSATNHQPPSTNHQDSRTRLPFREFRVFRGPTDARHLPRPSCSPFLRGKPPARQSPRHTPQKTPLQ